MVNWNLKIAGMPANPANFLVAALYDPTNLVTPFAYMTVPKPGGGYTGAAIAITFINLNQQVYEFYLYESTSSAPAGTVLIPPFSLQPSNTTTQIRADVVLEPGITAGVTVGASTYVDTSLVGWTYSVEKRGVSTLVQGEDYVQDVTGGWHLIGGNVFGAGDVYFEHFQPFVANAAAMPKLIAGSLILTVDTALDNTYVGKALLLQAAGSSINTTLPNLSTVTDNDVYMFFSAGGNHLNASLTCFGGDKIQYFAPTGSQLITKLILGQMENVKLWKFNGVWNIFDPIPGVLNVGEIIYKQSKGDINTIFADGSLLSRALYPRLFAYLAANTSLPVVSETTWINSISQDGVPYFTDKGKWTMGDGSTNFRIPLLFNTGSAGVGFFRAVDGSSRLSGSLQIDAGMDHQHDSEIGTFVGNLNGQGPTKVIPGYGAAAASRPSDLSSHPGMIVGGTFGISARNDYETRPQNIGVYALIKI